jgi:D-beta-D-heptose 7-phosphate kinase/D-beta-D-heptose 1-phosphate adenosyltransferase
VERLHIKTGDIMGSFRPLVAVSGGFDPIHKGHIQMILDAAKYGDVVVILNSDEWLERKKGYKFMDFGQRSFIAGSIKGVILTTGVDDSDGTVCEALRRIRPHYFANGGDRKTDNTPEMDVCNELGIKMLWNIGGGKTESSSWLVNKMKENK